MGSTVTGMKGPPSTDTIKEVTPVGSVVVPITVTFWLVTTPFCGLVMINEADRIQLKGIGRCFHIGGIVGGGEGDHVNAIRRAIQGQTWSERVVAGTIEGDGTAVPPSTLAVKVAMPEVPSTTPPMFGLLFVLIF